jgi:hypothetical protein
MSVLNNNPALIVQAKAERARNAMRAMQMGKR